MKFYAGIGSRETPQDVLDLMTALAEKLAWDGWTLRTGGAPGADQAFEAGAVTVDGYALRLYLPWPGFEGRASIKHADKAAHLPYSEATCFDNPEPWTFAIAEKHHPAWHLLKQGGRKLQARNVHQVLGHEVNFETEPQKSAFVVCWTKDGKASGGTGQAIRIAEAYGVPVRNLRWSDAREAAERFVAGEES